MQALIDRLRVLTEAARTDEFQGVLYWSDDQLEEVLDEARVSTPTRLSLVPSTKLISGEEAWYVQSAKFSRHLGFEDDYTVYSTAGTEVDSSYYTVEKYGTALEVTFDPNNVTNADYEIELTLYNLNWAAAEVWGRKADQRLELVDMKAGAHQFKGSQERQHCLDRQIYFRNKSARVFALPNKRRFTPANASRSRR